MHNSPGSGAGLFSANRTASSTSASTSSMIFCNSASVARSFSRTVRRQHAIGSRALRFFHFFPGAVALRIPHRVAAKAVRYRLDQLRTAAGPGPFGHLVHGVSYGEDVVPVDLHPGDVEGGRLPVDVADRGHALEGGPHSVRLFSTIAISGSFHTAARLRPA